MLPNKPRVTRLDGPSRITLGGSRGGSSSSAEVKVERELPTEKVAASRVHGFDYSKWDSIGCDDDSDEDLADDDDDARYGGEADWEDPLDASEQARLREVLKAADGTTTTAAATATATAAATAATTDSTSTMDSREAGQPPAASSSSSSSGPSSSLPGMAAPPASSAFELLRAKLTRNGAERAHYLWRQTEAEVELGVLLPAGTRAKELRPELLPADPLSGTRQRVSVHRALGVNVPPLFCEALAYPVRQPESAEDLAWEVSDYEPYGGRRLLRLTLQKEGPHGGGVVVWWSRAIEGEPSCDTTAFPDRRRAAAAQRQQDVWAEAEALFKAKVAAYPPPQQIDVGDDPS
jgi:hypothetical protein